MCGESKIENYNTICKIDSQWEFAVWLRELKQGLYDRLRLKGGVGKEMGWRSGREGTWEYLWLILVDVWQKTTILCTAIILQLKNLEKKESEVAQSCPTLCDPVDCSPPGSSVHGILQARILEWVPFPSPGDLPDPGIEPRSPALEADALTSEPPGKFPGLPRTIQHQLLWH